MIAFVLVLVLWLAAGTCLIWVLKVTAPEAEDIATVGDLLLLLAFGPLFLLPVLLTLLCDIPLPKRRTKPRPSKPAWRQEAEHEVEDWMRRR